MRLLSNKFDQPAMAIFRLVITDKVSRSYPNMPEKDLKKVVKFALRYGGNETAYAQSVTALKSSKEAEGEIGDLKPPMTQSFEDYMQRKIPQLFWIDFQMGCTQWSFLCLYNILILLSVV